MLACCKWERKVVVYLFPEEQLYSLRQLKMDKGSTFYPHPIIVNSGYAPYTEAWKGIGSNFLLFPLWRSGNVLCWGWIHHRHGMGGSFCDHSFHCCLGLRLGEVCKEVSVWGSAVRYSTTHAEGCAFKPDPFLCTKTSLAFYCWIYHSETEHNGT